MVRERGHAHRTIKRTGCGEKLTYRHLIATGVMQHAVGTFASFADPCRERDAEAAHAAALEAVAGHDALNCRREEV